MKWLALSLLVPVTAVACPKGSYEYRGGCVVDIQPISGTAVQPSDEKPPDDKMPSYQREGITVIDAPSTSAADAQSDRDKVDADTEGKKSAGL